MLKELQEGQRWRAAFRKLKAMAPSFRLLRSLLSAASQLCFNSQQTQRLGAKVCAGRLTLTVTRLRQKLHRSVEYDESALHRRSRLLLSEGSLIWSGDSTAKTLLIDIPCSG